MQDVMQALDDIKTEDIISHMQGMGYLVFLETEDEELISEVESRGYTVLKN